MTAIQCPGTRAWICKRARAGLVMKNSGYFSQFPGITEEDQKSFYKKKKNEEHEKDVYIDILTCNQPICTIIK